MLRQKRLKILKTIVVATVMFVLLLIGLASVYRQSLRNYRQAIFVDAALLGNVTRMRFLLAVGASVDAPACQTSLCPPPLVAAAYVKRSDAAELLLKRGANVNGRMERGQTALMIAAYHGHVDVVKLLLSKGADVNAVSEGDTALQWAKEKNHSDIADLLVKAGATR